MIAFRIDANRIRMAGTLVLIAAALWSGAYVANAAQPPAKATGEGAEHDRAASAPDEAAPAPSRSKERARPLILSPLLPPGTLPLPPLPASSEQAEHAGVDAGAGADDGQRNSSMESVPAPDEEAGADGRAVPLAPPDLAAIGLEEPDPAAGRPVDLWRASARSVITRLMAGLPVVNVAPAAREQALRLLLISAPLAPADAENDAPLALLRVRFERLAAAGEADRLLALGERLPPDFDDPAIAGHLVDAMLLVGRYDEACRLAEKENRSDGAARWLVTLTLCRALTGDTAGVDFLVGLLSETAGEEADGSSLPPPLATLALRLADEINGIDPPAPAPGPEDYHDTHLTPPLVALARLSRAPLPLAAVGNAGPLVLGALLGEEITTPAARLVVAHAALSAGIAPVERVAAVYAAHRFDEGERTALIEPLPVEQGAEDDAGLPEASTALDEARIEAALFQWVSEVPEPATVLERAGRALAASPRARAERLARLFSLPLAAIDPTAAFGGYATTAFDVFMLAGRPSTAWRWWLAGRTFAAEDRRAETTRALDRRAAVAMVALDRESFGLDAQDFHARLAEGVETLTPPARSHWLDIALAHLDALGAPQAPLSLELAALDPSSAGKLARSEAHAPVGATLWGRMMRAALAGRRGETMLAALVLDSEAHGGGLSTGSAPVPFVPAAGAAAVAGLARSGAEETARRLAARHLLISLWQAERESSAGRRSPLPADPSLSPADPSSPASGGEATMPADAEGGGKTDIGEREEPADDPPRS